MSRGGKGDKGGDKREVYLPRVYCYYLTTDPMLHMIALAQDY